MAGRIQEDAEVLPRLVLSLACSDGKDLCLGLIEIFDVEVEVRLLGPVGAGPDGWLVVRCPLEGQSGSRVAAKLDPVPTVIVQVEAGELGIELRQRPRVRAIEGYQAEPCDPVHVVAFPSRWILQTPRSAKSLPRSRAARRPPGRARGSITVMMRACP